MSEHSIVLLVAPSSAGKSTLAKMLQQTGKFQETISYTTRDPRPGEVDGKDYHFLSKGEFENLIHGGAFLEHVKGSGGYYYGTHKKAVEDIFLTDKNAVMVLEPHGAYEVQKNAQSMGINVVSCYISCPSIPLRLSRIFARLSENPTEKEYYGAAKRMLETSFVEPSWASAIHYDLTLKHGNELSDFEPHIDAIMDSIDLVQHSECSQSEWNGVSARKVSDTEINQLQAKLVKLKDFDVDPERIGTILLTNIMRDTERTPFAPN